MSDPSKYHVGWICAVLPEMVAARAFLDEQHDDLESQPVHDNNTYVLGKMGRHNVVIALLPIGSYGLVNASTVARDMLRTFPNIRIGLMVGIGGGVPSDRNDIRLGDVVVSVPGDGIGGVMQYDFGKTIQGQEFRRTAFMAQPPSLILAAVARLRADHQLNGSIIDSSIEEAIKVNPRLRSKYSRPDPQTDRLYESHHTHPSQGPEAGQPCGELCGTVMLKPRPVRSDEEDNPAIHYGRIASGNQVMKDALIRDRLAAERDVLCFEMEAAGLMNHFPCLVVRGICDYSDSHKNKRWQEYAAMAAAAYTKDLLSKVAPNKVEASEKIGDILSDLQDGIKGLRAEVGSIRAYSHQNVIRTWLSPSDPSTNLDKASDARHPGTGEWLLRDLAYSCWKSNKSSFLWLCGMPGCGKTILSSSIVRDLQETRICLYFYFDFSDSKKQSLDNALRSLICQLYDRLETTRDPLDSLKTSCGSAQPGLGSLRTVFQDMLERSSDVWIVIDALDECEAKHRDSDKGLLSWLQSLQENRGVQLLVTSRPEHDISSHFVRWARKRDMIPIQSAGLKEDINTYVHSKVRDRGVLSTRWRTRPKIQDEIESTLVEKADGMFRWAACQLEALESCIGPLEVRHALSNLPKTLDETYSRIIANIPSEYKTRAFRILQFLLVAGDPVPLVQIVEVIACDWSTQTFDPENRIPIPEEVVRYCSNLVSVDQVYGVKEGNYLQLPHFSVKEYLVSNEPDLQQIHASAAMANTCLIYLLHLEFNLSTVEVKRRYPLAEYAAQTWPAHVGAARDSELLIKKLQIDLLTNKNAYNTCYKLHGVEYPKTPPPLYYASFHGLADTVQALLDYDYTIECNIDARGGILGNALQAAALFARKAVVQILLDRGADVNAEVGGLYGTALQAATACTPTTSESGKMDMIKFLLDNGADINAKAGKYGSVLNVAVMTYTGKLLKTSERIVQLLLQHGADVNGQCGQDGNLLQAAALKGHGHLIQLLLSNGADINAQGGKYGTALQAAAFAGRQRILQLLLDNGANVNARGGEYDTALQAAACSSESEQSIVQLLLSYGADIHAQGGKYGSALSAAAFEGDKSTVQLLLDNGADVNSLGGRYGSALYACICGSSGTDEEMVHVLLDNGADVNAQAGTYGTALQSASSYGHEKTIKTLLDRGADVNHGDGEFGKALTAHCGWAFSPKVADLLLEKGAHINARAAKGIYAGQTALSVAVKNGILPAVELLIKRGADVQMNDLCNRSLLHHCAIRGDKRIFGNLLRNTTIKVDGRDRYGTTPLSLMYLGDQSRHGVGPSVLRKFSSFLPNRRAYICRSRVENAFRRNIVEVVEVCVLFVLYGLSRLRSFTTVTYV
ncbi:ankyrin repeat-containing domain protein [Xylariaceae sp. FL0255]|nr:ankyrin repeat-containing domain protein [Xylariaceae sp. FL0255]